MRYTVRPISDRSAFTGKHRLSPFKSDWTRTLNLLQRELHAVRGTDVVIECDVPERDIRIDGQLYARARPASPAIRVAFESKHGPLVYATDRFAHWQDNVRAVALGLEALRKIDRYGISGHGEQYRGFKALPAGVTVDSMTHNEAAVILERVAVGDEPDRASITISKILLNPTGELARDVWREARRVTHPDVRDGDDAMWHEVERAGRVLGLAGGR